MMQQRKEEESLKAVTLSNRMMSLLEEAYESGGITMERITQISQTTAGAVMKRDYFAWNEKYKKFMLSDEGLRTRERFFHTTIDRKDTERPFGKLVVKYGGGKHGFDRRVRGAAA